MDNQYNKQYIVEILEEKQEEIIEKLYQEVPKTLRAYLDMYFSITFMLDELKNKI